MNNHRASSLSPETISAMMVFLAEYLEYHPDCDFPLSDGDPCHCLTCQAVKLLATLSRS